MRSPLRRLHDLLPEIETIAKMGRSTAWGFPALDAIAPWPINGVAVISAPKGGGKTSFGLEISRRYARSQGPVLFVNLEQTAAMLAARAYGQELNVPQNDLTTGVHAIDPAVASDDPFFVATRLPLDDIAETLDAIAELDNRPPLLAVDYVQKYGAGAADQRIACINAMDKLLALTESRPMRTLAISQTSRSGSRRARHNGSGEDLIDMGAESGATESDPAIMLGLTFPSRNGESTTHVTAVAAKNRFGATGVSCGFTFDGATGRWEETAEPAPDSLEDRIRTAVGQASRLNITRLRGAVGARNADVRNAADRLIADGVLVCTGRGRGRMYSLSSADGSRSGS